MKKENGFALIETIVGVGIIAAAGLAFISGMLTSIKSEEVQRGKITGKILATGEMEYVMRQPYSISPWSYNVTSSQRFSNQQPSWWDIGNPPLLPNDYTGYLVSVTAIDFDADADGVLEVPGDDSDIRRITVKVYHPETKLIVTLENNKANR